MFVSATVYNAALATGRGLGLLPRPADVSGLAGPSAQQPEYYRIFQTVQDPGSLYLEAVWVEGNGSEETDFAFKQAWHRIGPDGVSHPFDYFALYPSHLARLLWRQDLVEFSPAT